MGCWEHLRLLLFLCISVLLCFSATASAISAAGAPASFDSCFPTQAPDQFWNSQLYVLENPNIMKLPFFNFYSFGFDNTLQGLSPERIEIIPGNDFLREIPEKNRGEFSRTASYLDQAGDSLSQSAEFSGIANQDSLSAKNALTNAFGVDILLAGAMPSSWAILEGQKIAAVANYALNYPSEYSDALSLAAGSFDSVNLAGRETAAKVESEFSTLSKAGAGSPAYSGGAKDAYFSAESFLSEGGACAKTSNSAQTILNYFSSKPQMPGFSQLNFRQYMEYSAGKQNSTLLRLAALYSDLAAANEKMDSERLTSQTSAQTAISRLSIEIQSLSKENLELIGDSRQSASSPATVSVGTEYSGINSALDAASLDLDRAKNEISLSRLAADSKSEDYLAEAISRAHAANGIAENALLSASGIRSDSESAIAYQQELARSAISRADSLVSQTPISIPTSLAHTEGARLLSMAQESFSSAERATTLGKRYQGFSEAKRLADQSIKAFNSQTEQADLQSAQESVRKFSAMIPKAKADGLDISSEEARLATLKSLLSSSTSLSTAAAVSQSANSEYSALVLRLYETFSYLEERYSYASALFSEVKKSKPQADCGLLEISRDFQAGKLNAERAAGKMLSLSSKIDECAGMAEKLVPLRLSEVLSQNSETLELYQPPILGQQTKYSATISTENPTSLSSDSKVSFNAKTTSQIYSSDQDSGDHLSDAYPDNDKTALEVSSVSAWQSFSFSFAKLILPAQKTSSRDECAFASQHEAEVVRTIGFFSSSALPSLQISEPVPSGAQSASAEFQGTSYGLEMLGGPSAETMQGEINSVPSGKSVLAITYLVRDPFSLELSSRTVESLPGGITKVSFTAKAGSFKTQCDSASATFFEPYSGISNISAVYSPGQPAKIFASPPASLQNSTEITLSFIPSSGAQQSFAISYILYDANAALASALSSAQLQVQLYNRSSDLLALSEAEALIHANKTSDALALLGSMTSGTGALAYSYADRAAFLDEKASLDSELEQTQSAMTLMSLENLTAASAALSVPEAQCKLALSSAITEFDNGNPSKALPLLRKARADFTEAEASAVWDFLKGVSSQYAKAKLQGNQDLSLASEKLSLANQLYSEGKYSEAQLEAARAQAAIESAKTESDAFGASISQLALQMQANYSAFHPQVESQISEYSKQYSSLSASEKQRLPFTPAVAQAKLDESDKGLAASKKTTLTPQESLSQANSSFQSLLRLSQSLNSTLQSLDESARSSLSTAKAALSEAKAKFGSTFDISQAEAEISRADDFLQSGLFADSMASSDRATRALTAVLQSGTGAPDPKALLIGALSIAFIIGAAYFFMRARKKEEKKEKKEIPKADEIQGA